MGCLSAGQLGDRLDLSWLGVEILWERGSFEREDGGAAVVPSILKTAMTARQKASKNGETLYICRTGTMSATTGTSGQADA